MSGSWLDDWTLAELPTDDPDAERAAAAWRVQCAYLAGHGDREFIVGVFGRLVRGRDGWQRSAERARVWFP